MASPENSTPVADSHRPMLPGECPGQVQHLEDPVAEVDHIAVVEQRRRRRGEPFQQAAGQPALRHRVDEQVGHVVPRIDVRLAHRRPELGDVEGHGSAGPPADPLRTDGSRADRTRACRRRGRRARASPRRARRGRARARPGAAAVAGRARCRRPDRDRDPRTCHTLQRRSGWTCGSLIKRDVVADASTTNHGSATGRSSTDRAYADLQRRGQAPTLQVQATGTEAPGTRR